MKHLISVLLTAALMTLSLSSMAQKTASQGIDEYRAMLQDGNPADLFEAKGEGLWKQKRGPKNASLEKSANLTRLFNSVSVIFSSSLKSSKHIPIK